jgi:predicted nucleic acid-binding Zn ribbon protein
MAKNKPTKNGRATDEQRRLRTYQVLMAVVGVIIILTMIITLVFNV